MASRMSRKKKRIYRAICVIVVLILAIAFIFIGTKLINWILSGPTSSASSSSSGGTSSALPQSSSSEALKDTSSETTTSTEPGTDSSQPNSSQPTSSVISSQPDSSQPTSSSVSSQPASSQKPPVQSPSSAPISSVGGTSTENSGIYTGVTWRSPYSEPADIFKHGRDLMLLNREYELPLDFKWDLVYWSNGQPVDAMSLNSKKYDSVKAVDRAAYQPLKDMFTAAQNAGVPLQMVSAYRSINLQDRLFNELVVKYSNSGMSKQDAINKANTSRTFTGTSEHNTGYGFDILEAGNWYLSTAFENTKQFKWLSEHAADYGFILRYPKDKVDITGIMYEPWHYRYVGVEAAREIKEKGMCFEEYIEYLDRTK